MSRIWWGSGAQIGSFAPVLDRDGIGHSIVTVYSAGYLEIPLGRMERRHPFTEAALRGDLVSGLAKAGFALAKDTGYPTIRLSALTDTEALARFIGVLDWTLNVIVRGSTQS